MDISIGYGKGEIMVNIADRNLLAVLTPNNIKIETEGEEET